jgi:hypothetical protein
MQNKEKIRAERIAKTLKANIARRKESKQEVTEKNKGKNNDNNV